MAFKIKKVGFEEGLYDVRIVEVELKTFNEGKEAIRIKVENNNKETHNFLVFTTNYLLIQSLLNLAYDSWDEDEEFNEQDLVNIEMRIETVRNGSYLNIVNVEGIQDYADFEF